MDARGHEDGSTQALSDVGQGRVSPMDVEDSETVPVRRECSGARVSVDECDSQAGDTDDDTAALSGVDDDGPLQWLRDGTRDGHRSVEGLRVLLGLLVFGGSALSRIYPASVAPFDVILTRPATMMFTVALGFGATVGAVTAPGPGAQRIATLHATFLPAFVAAVAVTVVTGTFKASWVPEGTPWIVVLLRFCGAATGLYTDFESHVGRHMWYHGAAQTLLLMLAVKPMATLRLVVGWSRRKTPQRVLAVAVLVSMACGGTVAISVADLPTPLARSVLAWLLPCALGGLIGTSTRFVAVSTAARFLRGVVGIMCDGMTAGIATVVFRSLGADRYEEQASLGEHPELLAPLAAAWVWCLANGAGITQWVLSRSAVTRWAPATCAFYLLTDAAWSVVEWALGRDASSAPPPPWLVGYVFAWNALASFAIVSFAVPRWARLTLPVWEWLLGGGAPNAVFTDLAVDDADHVLTVVLSAVRDLSRTPRATPATRLDAIGLGSLELAGLAAVLNRRAPASSCCGGISVSSLRHCESVGDIAVIVARNQMPSASI